MGSNIATNLELVRSRIDGTTSSRDEMIQSLTNLEQSIQQATEWKGIDAEAYKAALLDFCKKLKSSAAWMEAAGSAAKIHSQKLYDRAQRDQNARIFE